MLFEQPYVTCRIRLAASLEAAAELACEHYVLHGGAMGVIQHDGLEDAYARQREWLVRAGDLARSLGISEEEARRQLAEKEARHGVSHGLDDEDTTTLQ